MFESINKSKGQISLEFLIVYSFVLIIFILIFTLITGQKAVILNQQEYSLLQLQAQNVASYIDQAAIAGNGYSVVVPLVSGFETHTYNLSISSTGVVIASTKSGTQPITGYAFSSVRTLVINGTVQPQSANGITVYSLSTTKGSITISNSKGIIYVDQQPASTKNLAQGSSTTQSANIKTAIFTPLISCPNLSICQPLETTNAPILNTPSVENAITVTAWLYPTSAANTLGYFSKSSYGGGTVDSAIVGSYILALYSGSNNNRQPAIYLNNAGSWYYGTSTVPVGKWSFVAITFNAGSISFYVYNTTGSSVSTASASVSTLQSSACYDSIGIQGGCLPLNLETSPEGGYPFFGGISNLQVYNASLSANNIRQIYNLGISGKPSITGSLIAYWPLNGNPNDYSGYGNSGTPNAVQYNSVIQLNERVISGGNSIANDFVGFVSSTGSLSTNGPYASDFTNKNGTVTEYLNNNGSIGSANVAIDVFNGNIQTESNLIGWWPLDTGYGNSIYDLSGNHNTGAFNSYGWSFANQTSFATAKFPGNKNGYSSNGLQDGFITVNSSQSLLGIASNNSFTAIAWIYFKGNTINHNQGIFGDWPYTGQGFQVMGYCITCANAAVLYVNGSYVKFPSGFNSFPVKTWEMVTAEYNGTTGRASVYLNNTLFATNLLPTSLGLAQTGNYYIGDDPWTANGYDTFNGAISNLQLYSSYLSPTQISTLYNQGLASNPLGDSGLISWWPLAGNADDYSFNNNTGTVNYNVIFSNSNYTKNAKSQSTYAYFNNKTTYVNTGKASILQPATAITVSAWVKPNNSEGLYPQIVTDGDKSGLSGYNLYFYNYNSLKAPSFVVNSIGQTWGACWAMGTSVNFKTNNWYFVTGTYNGYYINVYVDGISENSVSCSNTGIGYGSIPTGMIGWKADNSTNDKFNGTITDAQVYNSVLTSQQIMQLYQQGFPIQTKLNVSLG